MRSTRLFSRLMVSVCAVFPFILSVYGSGEAAERSPRQIASYTIASPYGDWGYPSPYLHLPRGPAYIRMSFIFDTLVWKDHNGFIPALAKEWTYDKANNAYTFYLRENAVWHDGKPVTAEDVAFTVDYVKKHPYPFVSLTGPGGVKRTEVINASTVKVYLENLYAPFLNDTAGVMVILPKHIWENVDDPLTFDGPEALIGSGPYSLVKYNKAQGTYVYKAFDDYYQGKPIVDRLVFVNTKGELIPAALTQHQINAAEIQAEMVDLLKAKGLSIMTSDYNACVKLTINHRKDPMNQKQFRQALAYAIDREALVKITQRGHGIPGSPGLMPPDNPWYNPNIPQYEYNPEKAKKLIEGLGYTLGQNGYFSKDGRPLELELVNTTYKGHKDVGAFIMKALESVGIKINHVLMEVKSLDAKVLAWDFDLSIFFCGGLFEASILPKLITAPAPRSARYTANKELNQLLKDQLHEMDPDTRLKLVRQALALYAEDMPNLTLYYPNIYWCHDGQIPWYYTEGGIASGFPFAYNKMAVLGK